MRLTPNYQQDIKEMLEMIAQNAREHDEMAQRLIFLKEVREDGDFLYWINSGKRVGVEQVITNE